MLVTNSFETLASLDLSLLSEDCDLFWLVYNAAGVLFMAKIVAPAILIFGFSMAGGRSRTIPRAVTVPGFVASAFVLFAGVFIGSVTTASGWAAVAFEIGATASLALFPCVCTWLLLRGGIYRKAPLR